MNTSPRPTSANLTDHTYVVLDDGSLFCVAGNRHTATEVLGCLYYTPLADLDEWGDTPEPERPPSQVKSPDGSATYKIGPAVARHPGRFHQALTARGIRWWPSTHLQAVARDRIAHVLDPVAMLARLLPARHDHRCPLEILARLATRTVSDSGPLHGIGLTGSAAFHDTNICAARDLDLVLIDPIKFATFTAAAHPGWQPLALLGSDDPRRMQYLAERLPPATVDSVETQAITARRVDVGWIGEVRIDLTEVAPPCPVQERWPFDMPSLGTVETNGSVSTVGNGYPFLLTLNGNERSVMVTRRGWQGVLRAGDRLVLRGDEFYDNGQRLLVVDDRSHHQMRLIPQVRHSGNSPCTQQEEVLT